ncbi:MAG TPA: DUF3426 domain-containing protein [Gammaproteobacteria bacterium]|nr:DUF3426 domain-containing protein [Gammaproteobacteria bacterium]
MLFTRCPECGTTFRVTDEALKKAHGQVRCGRCASVFNALAEQIEATDSPARTHDTGEPVPPVATPPAPEAARRDDLPSADHATPEPVPSPPEPETPVAPVSAEESPPAGGPAAARPDAIVGETRAPPPATERTDLAVAAIGASSIAEVVAEAEIAAAAADEPATSSAPGADAPAISAEQIEEVLGGPADTPLLGQEPPWPLQAAPRPRASRWWIAASALAVLAFGVQLANHFRTTLAAHPVFGPWTQAAYALVGVTVTPNWDVRQYEILDWVAAAEPNVRGVGSLKITARIQNRGPQRQPYPEVQLRLKDRWEKAVGSRMFKPEEYLSHDAPHAALMAAGETARAEISIVDPGPDAYGFELDVCIEVEARTLTCRGDKVFR